MGDTGCLGRLAEAMVAARTGAVALTGAGVSAPSGIPDFRSPGGLWQRYDPFEHGHIAALREDPGRVWDMLWELDALVSAAEPNPAHKALADLEHQGVVRAVITQNPDQLHQRAGSARVVELHGSGAYLSCMHCARTVERQVALSDAGRVPVCDTCGGVLRPGVVFFGEALPEQAVTAAWEAARACDVFLVVGTSAEVEPAAGLPRVAEEAGAQVWEVNPQAALDRPVHGRIARPAEEALTELAAEVAARR